MTLKLFIFLTTFLLYISLSAQDKNYEEWYLKTNDKQDIFIKELGWKKNIILFFMISEVPYYRGCQIH